jgi:hypothetical protein
MSYTEKEVQGVIQGMVDAINQQKGKMESRFEGYDKTMDEFAKTLSAIETAVARGQYPGGGGSSLSGFGAGVDTQAAREHKEKFLAWARKGRDGIVSAITDNGELLNWKSPSSETDRPGL